MMAMSESRRPHTRSPWREAFELIATRPTGGSESSCELTRNAKGHVQVSVTARAGTAALSGAEAQAEFDRLCALYPYPTNGSHE